MQDAFNFTHIESYGAVYWTSYGGVRYHKICTDEVIYITLVTQLIVWLHCTEGLVIMEWYMPNQGKNYPIMWSIYGYLSVGWGEMKIEHDFAVQAGDWKKKCLTNTFITGVANKMVVSIF